MNRLEIENQLEQKYLNKVSKYRTITNKIIVGKIDRIAYDCTQGCEVIFIINNERYTADLEWVSENLITL